MQLTTTLQLTQEGKDTLESLLDGTNASYLISALAEICQEKADHLRTNWQDENAAKAWDRAGLYLFKVSETASIRTIS